MAGDFLTDAEKAGLRASLEYLRQVTGMTYKDIGTAAELDGVKARNAASRIPRLWQENLASFAVRRGIDLSEATRLAGQLEALRAQMDINIDILKSDAETYGGEYLCFVLLQRPNLNGDNNAANVEVGVTSLELMKETKGVAFPRFVAGRTETDGDVLQFEGYYYLYKKVLNAIGYRTGTAYPWHLSAKWQLDKSGNGFIGTVLTSSHTFSSYSAPCFALRNEEGSPFSPGRYSLERVVTAFPFLKEQMSRLRIHSVLRLEGI